jgi:hypothetical protein
MFDWLIDPIFAALKSIPALFTEEGSPNFLLVRAMLGLALLTLILYLIAMRPFRSAISQGLKKLSKLIVRNP